MNLTWQILTLALLVAQTFGDYQQQQHQGEAYNS